MSDWLVTSILPHEQHPERLPELICTECRTREIEVPNDIAALIETGRLSYEGQIYTTIAARLTPEMQERLDALLVAAPIVEGEEEEELPLSLLRLDPGPVSVESALSEIAKLRSLRAIGLAPDLFAGYAAILSLIWPFPEAYCADRCEWKISLAGGGQCSFRFTTAKLTAESP